jgi:hypothetical protein
VHYPCQPKHTAAAAKTSIFKPTISHIKSTTTKKKPCAIIVTMNKSKKKNINKIIQQL